VVKGAAFELLRHAENNDADLILKALSAADMEQDTSTVAATLSLVREASIPVWLCSPHRRRTNRVLAVVNAASANRANERVIRAGARVAALQGAALHVLCVDREASRQPHENVLQSDALTIMEKAVLDLEPDIVVLNRDGTDLTGLPGTHLVERLFCRVECSMLLVPPLQGIQPGVHPPSEPRPFRALGRDLAQVSTETRS
jgi:hypothetical protein